MEFDEFKFNLGQIVTTAMHDGYGAGDRLLIVGQVFTRTTTGVRREYVTSHYKLGDMVRSVFYEEELAEVKA